MDEIWMMTPDPCFSIPGSSARSRRTAANRLALMVSCQSSSPRASTPPLGAEEPPIVDEDVHAGETVQYLPDHLVHALACADVGLDEHFHSQIFWQWPACGGRHLRASSREAAPD